MKNKLLDMHSCVQKEYSDLISKSTSPLKELLDIPFFSYKKVTESGLYTSIYNHSEFYEFFLENQFFHNDPYLVTPEKYKDGRSIQLINRKIHALDPGLEEIHKIATKTFNLSDSIVFIDKFDGYYETFVFSMSPIDNILLIKCVSQMDLLERFIKYFKKECLCKIKCLDELAINMAKLKGEKFYLPPPNYELINKNVRDSFLQFSSKNEYELSMKIKGLNNREKECLYWIIQGKTAEETGHILKISRRTVECHRTNIKSKLGEHYSFSNLCYLIGKYSLL